MEPAREELAAAIATTFSPYLSGIKTANAVSNPAEIKKNLIIQLTAPVNGHNQYNK
jgi:[acyl-carrier-protein] S-malonyltransferase